MVDAHGGVVGVTGTDGGAGDVVGGTGTDGCAGDVVGDTSTDGGCCWCDCCC